MNKNLTIILIGILFILTASQSSAQGTLSKINLNEFSKARTLNNTEISRLSNIRTDISNGDPSNPPLVTDPSGGPSYASVIELDILVPRLNEFLQKYKNLNLRIFNASRDMSLLYSGPVNTIPNLTSLLPYAERGTVIYTQLIGITLGTSQVEILSEHFYEIQ